MSKRNFLSRIAASAGALALCLAVALPHTAWAQATIVIENADGPGEGFNDPTSVAPVGGNAATTLGQQRLNVFKAAANIWGATLTSSVTITVRSNFDPLTCTATSAVLGAAGARFVVRDFPGAGFNDTWYGEALGNKLAGTNLVGNEPEIQARFNSNLGQPGCLTGSPFYLGLDNNVPPGQVNLLVVVLHELAHGLNFQTFTSGATGAQLAGLPSIYDYFLRDTTTGKSWVQMTDAERVASAVNFRRVVWDGANVTAAAPSVLDAGSPILDIASTPVPSASGSYPIGTAAFGPPLSSPPIVGQVMPVSTPVTGAACNPLAGADAIAVRGNIALIDRGSCAFSVKVKNAQNAGARGVIIANNVAGTPPNLGGSDPTITIPAVSISLNDANILKNALRFRSRTASGVVATMGVNPGQLVGADVTGRVLMFTPNPFQPGSSVSHWDTLARPNLLMEPSINADLTQSVDPPEDLTFPLLQDIGW
jgi:hypothetical protein